MSRWRFLPSYHYEDSTDGKIDNPAELQLRDYTIGGGVSGAVGDYSTATGKYEIPIKISGKNMFNVNQEINFRFPSLQTPSVDGNTITVSNAAYATGGMWCNIPVKAGAYTLSVGSTTNNIYINYFAEPINEWNFSTMTVGAHVIGSSTTPPVALPIEAQADGYIVIFALFTSASADNTVTTAVFKNIQVERGTVATAYEPYTEPRTQTISLDSPVGVGESVSMRADNLPAITLNKGSNIITVETDITPTGVTYQYYTY